MACASIVSSVCFKNLFSFSQSGDHSYEDIKKKMAIIPRKIHPRYKVQGKRVLVKNMKNLPCLI
jgi:hypothetical protein